MGRKVEVSLGEKVSRDEGELPWCEMVDSSSESMLCAC